MPDSGATSKVDVMAVLLLALTLIPGLNGETACAKCPESGRPQLAVIVREHLAAALPPTTLARIARDVRSIWGAHIGVELMAADRAVDFPADDTLDLVLTDRESSRSGDGLGWIEFVNDEPSRTITVSVTTARRLADAARWQGRPISTWPPSLRETLTVRALALGIAHEIGHYLLRSKTHTPRGLMRDVMSAPDLIRPLAARQLLTADDVIRLKSRAASYMLARQARTGGGPL
jgi:hypothetical protein